MEEIYTAVLDCLKKDTPVSLVTVVDASGSTPGKVGNKMLVYRDGSTRGTVGGGRLEALVIEAAQEVIETGRARLSGFTLNNEDAASIGMVCGGRISVFIEPVAMGPKLVIAGGGHISKCLCPLAKSLGYSVTVIDDRQEFVNEERFPAADRLEVGNIVDCLGAMEINRRTYLVIVTRGHACDEEALHAVVNKPAAYIGMIGSQRKVELVFRNLEEKGVSAAALRKVRAPIGLDIGGDTPMELALSIMAQLQQVRYEK